jgi:RNA polymerase sigma factor FliA
VARNLGVGVHDLDAVDFAVQRASVLSLQNLTKDDGAELLPSLAAGPEQVLLKREQIGYLRDAIAELPDRLRTVVEQYFFAQRKMLDIAQELGVTESRVSQLRSEALALLHAGMRGYADVPAPPAATGLTRRRAASRAAYCDAVEGRSTLADRLQATSLLGEARHTTRVAG